MGQTSGAGTGEPRVDEIFADARSMQTQAIERLEAGDIRDAAEKAWCAAKRATDALVLARTRDEPPSTHDTTEGLLALAGQSGRYETLVGRYFTRISYLHGSCFYTGICGPDVERRIRETGAYIDDAVDLAGAAA